MKLKAVFFLSVPLFTLFGCGGTLERPSSDQDPASQQVPLSDEIKASLGTIGVLSSPGDFQLSLPGPSEENLQVSKSEARDGLEDASKEGAEGKAGEALKGAVGGALGLPIYLGALAGSTAVLAAPILVPLAVVGAVLGAYNRTRATGMSVAEVRAREEAIPTLRRLVAHEAIGRKLTERIHALAPSTVSLDSHEFRGTLVDAASLTQRGIDTVLELRPQELSLADCVCGFRLVVAARLVRVADGSVVDKRTFHYVTTSHQVRVVDWAADDAAMLRQVLPLIYTRLAEQVIAAYLKNGPGPLAARTRLIPVRHFLGATNEHS